MTSDKTLTLTLHLGQSPQADLRDSDVEVNQLIEKGHSPDRRE